MSVGLGDLRINIRLLGFKFCRSIRFLGSLFRLSKFAQNPSQYFVGQGRFWSELDGALGHRQGILRVMLLHGDDCQAHEGQRTLRCQLYFLA